MNFTKEQSLQTLEKYGLAISEQEYDQNSTKKVVVGMSGGVDSSVSALVLKLQGYQVTGLFMKNWDEIDEDGQCSATEDYEDVALVSEKLEIPYYSINLVEEYKKNVFDTFIEEFKMGETPNPDILCNREIKFKVFFNYAMELGADFLATGHYCQKKTINGVSHLVKGKDGGKDQTYFLYTIKSQILDQVLFPIGSIEKKIVRQMAHDFDLATKAKKDSTGICFIGERNFKKFLSEYIESTKGNFVDLEGNVLGPHDGLPFYTIGQRKGLGIGGPGGPWFVAGKNKATNEVIVVSGEEHPALYAQDLETYEISWVDENEKSFPLKCSAKVRYRQADQPCTVTQKEDGLKVIFDEPQRAITKRQSVVFYQDDICLGGGIIDAVGPTLDQQA